MRVPLPISALVRALAPRALTLALCLLVVAPGCGASEPHFRQRTAAEWAGDVWSPNLTDAERAHQAIRAFSVSHPALVTDALAAELTRPRPAPGATPFSLRLDLAASKRLGLEPMPAPEALELDLTPLNHRIADSGITLGSLHGDAKGNVDVILDGGRSRAEAERVQRLLCRRGALDLRAILDRPAGSASDASEFTAWFDAERANFEAAEKEGVAYRPQRADRRLVRGGSNSEDGARGRLEAIEEPGSVADAFDERMIETVRGVVEADGRGRVQFTVLPARRDDFARWTGALLGREIAVLRDGVIAERMRLTKAYRDRFQLAANGELGDPPNEARRAREDAAVLKNGRLPRPLEPIALAANFGADPAPSNPISRLLLELGVISIPALERVGKDAHAPSWSKKSAEWALGELKKFEAETRKDR